MRLRTSAGVEVDNPTAEEIARRKSSGSNSNVWGSRSGCCWRDRGRVSCLDTPRVDAAAMRPFVIGSLLAAVVPLTVAGQQLQLGPRVALGDGSAFTAQAAIRADVLWQQWGFYSALGVRMATASCLLRIPGSCTLPSSPAWEFVAGVTRAPRGTPAYFSLGAGAMRWGGGTDPLLEGEFGLRFPVSRVLRFGLGVHVLVAPGVERMNVREKDVHFLEGVAGLSFGVGRP